MDIHVIKIPSNTMRNATQNSVVLRVMHDAILYYHAREALDAHRGHATDYPEGSLAEGEVVLDAGPWACKLHFCLLDDFVIRGGTINFKCLFEVVGGLYGLHIPRFPQKDGQSFGLVGYIGFDARRDLTVQVLVHEDFPEGEIHPGWQSNLTPDSDLETSLRVNNATLVRYGVVQR